MSWPASNIAANGTLIPFTTDQIKALELRTKDIRQGDHPTFNIDSAGCSVRRQWFSKWSMRDNALAALLGYVNLAGTFPNYTLSRVMPQLFPDAGYQQYIALAAETVKGARSAGVDDANTVPAYKSAELVIRYEQVFWGLGADGVLPESQRYVEQLPSTTETSVLSLPGAMMNYLTSSGSSLTTPDGILIPYNVGRVEVLTKMAFKWHRLPYEAWYPGSPLFTRVKGDPSNRTVNVNGKIVGMPYIGTVNSAPFLGYPSGAVLFDGVDEEIVPDPVRGYPCWNLIYRFTVRSNMSQASVDQYSGWNYLYYNGGSWASFVPQGYYFAARGSTYYPNGIIPDGITLYNERNHNNLFNVGAVADLLI